MNRIFSSLIIVLMSLLVLGCGEIDIVDGLLGDEENNLEQESVGNSETSEIDEDGSFTNHEDVALYIHTYGKLPNNFITKGQARDLGWEASKGNLWDLAPGKSIGGDPFGNREALLPKKEGRKYYEADVNYQGGFREAERIVYSNDGLIYYTDDHYDSFTLLYGEE